MIICTILVVLLIFYLKSCDFQSNFEDYLIFFKNYGKSEIQNVKDPKEIDTKLQNKDYQELDEEVIKYNFEVSYKNTEFKSVNLLETINSKTLVNEKIAPGTKGEFSIILNANQHSKYQVNFKSHNKKPYNLKFYIKQKNQEYRNLEELQKELKGEIKTRENKKIDICWEWKYETNKPNLELQDKQDALDGMKIQKYNFTINVLGEPIGKE